jgi:TIR domain
MRVFISHAWEDKPLALSLAQVPDFIDAWVDVRELLGGERLDPTIITAIEDSHVFIVLISRISLAKAWVAQEVNWAMEREAQKDRVFVLPVVIEAGIDLAASAPPFQQFAQRLFIDASDRSEAGIAKARSLIAGTLFHWASDWLDRMEPRGDSNRRFADTLERDLVEFQTRLFAVKAALAWPLPTLVQDEAVAHLIQVKDAYNTFTERFIPHLGDLDADIRWRFGVAAQRGFMRLTTFIRNEVYHGAAFALNDAIESINAFETVLSKDAPALAAAESRRQARVAALEPVMAELVERTADYVDTLRP